MSDRIDRKRLLIGCVVSLVATAFGFAVRGAILNDWRVQFNLSQEQIGYLLGAGLFPFAISIVLFSLVIDRIGNRISMAIAFTLHVVSAIITLAAPFALAGAGASPEEIASGQKLGFALLYLGTFVFALGNGTVEAVVNPVVASLYPRDKTRYLNILHAGWPGGLVLGGLLAIAVSRIDPSSVPGSLWQWQMGLVLVPTIAYGLLLMGHEFPVNERVAANVPYIDMLREFGAGSCYIVSFFLLAGLSQILVILGVPPLSMGMQAVLALVPTVLFALYVKSFGRPMFVLLLLVMVLLATTELGTDSWIADIMRTVLGSPTLGILFLVWTSLIMFVLRFFAGPIVHKLSPLGLLAASAAMAALGLVWLAKGGSAAGPLFVAATLYGFGKTFFWPTTLGVVSEQYPRGGALMLNAIAGVGMIAVGTIGGPAIGAVLDRDFAAEVRTADPNLAQQVLTTKAGVFGESEGLDPAKRAQVTEPAQVQTINSIEHRTKQAALAKIAILPVIMLVIYLGLIAYFRARGGYKAQHLVDDAVPEHGRQHITT